jgi:hypothetical protein
MGPVHTTHQHTTCNYCLSTALDAAMIHMPAVSCTPQVTHQVDQYKHQELLTKLCPTKSPVSQHPKMLTQLPHFLQLAQPAIMFNNQTVIQAVCQSEALPANTILGDQYFQKPAAVTSAAP